MDLIKFLNRFKAKCSKAIHNEFYFKEFRGQTFKNTTDKAKISPSFPWHNIVNRNHNILSNLHTCGGAFISFSHELLIAMLNNEKNT